MEEGRVHLLVETQDAESRGSNTARVDPSAGIIAFPLPFPSVAKGLQVCPGGSSGGNQAQRKVREG